MLIPFSDLIRYHRPKGIIHIGAWDGIEMQDYIAHGIDRVIFIEANSEIMPTLIGRVAPYPNSRVINACVADRKKQVTFNITSNKQSSSYLQLDEHLIEHPEVQVEKIVTIEAQPMTDIISEYAINIEDYDMLNIDVQGAELDVLRGFDDLLFWFKTIYAEVNLKHLYRDCPLVGDIDRYLYQFEFMRLDTKFTAHGWGDAIYLR